MQQQEHNHVAIFHGFSPLQDKQIVRLLGKVPTLAALAYHKSTGRSPALPNQRLGYTENFLYMLDGANSANAYRPHPKLVRALVSYLKTTFLKRHYAMYEYKWLCGHVYMQKVMLHVFMCGSFGFGFGCGGCRMSYVLWDRCRLLEM